MSRDWDLLAVFSVGSVIAAGYLVLHTVDDRAVKQRIMLLAAFISMIHFAAYVTINTDEARAIPRFMTLVDNSLWGTKAFTVFEELAIYYREKNDPPASAEYYRRFLEHDSTNGRVFGNYADALRASGDEEGERGATERAIKLGSANAGLYFNLGVIYGKEGRYDEAIGAMEKGLEKDPHRADILNSIGAFLMQGKMAYDDALPYFRRAIAEDSSYALAYLNSGLCHYRLGNNGEAGKFLTIFLTMEPRYPKKQQIQEILSQISPRK
jgi:Tfp pilus assembly protein PilF